ncbi:MAG: putative sulfate/molybdate transporter [Elusimicrobia bacterium]|nr:putative sulfate/molybdate transporter [Elusimicrobiota bacterium]
MADADGLLPLRFGPNEWLGALGDLGTFGPLYLGLVAVCGLAPGRALLLFGLVYVCSSLVFRVPVPVQPLKAMAAICIAGALAPALLAAGGLGIGLILTALALAGRVDWLGRFFSRPIVKGIQFGVGLILVKKGVELILGHGPAARAAAAAGGFSLPSWAQLWAALPLLVIPQLPLTLGNAVYAVSDVEKDYFGAAARRATPRNIALSLGLSDIVIGACGGLPICHGSGGLSAHYGFGARSAGATLITGTVFIAAALLMPHGAPRLIADMPHWLLGAMLVYPGACHMLLLRKLDARVPLAAAIGVVGAAFGSLAWALAFGLAAQALLDRRLLPAPAGS